MKNMIVRCPICQHKCKIIPAYGTTQYSKYVGTKEIVKCNCGKDVKIEYGETYFCTSIK